MVELQWNLYEADTNRTLASVRLIEMSAKYRFLLHWRSCLLNTGCPLNMGYAKYRFHCSPAAYNFTWHKYNNYKHTWKVWFQKISIPFSRRVFRFEPPLFRKFHFNFKSLAFDTPAPEFPVTIHGVAMDIFVELHTCNFTSICLLVWWMCLKNEPQSSCSLTDRKPFIFCNFKISQVVGQNTVNISEIFPPFAVFLVSPWTFL